MYKLKDKYKNKPLIIAKVGNKRVNLAGSTIKKVIPATERKPQRESIVEAATQADLKVLYEKGSVYIEKIEKPVPAEPAESETRSVDIADGPAPAPRGRPSNK